jgi:hypothetical protein
MKVAILSDIHDHLWNLDVARSSFTDCGQLICCGDLCSPFVIDELVRFPHEIHVVFGNNDADLFRITGKARSHPQLHLHGEFCELTMDGRRFAVNHFDYIARPIAQSEKFDVVCFGHNHQYEMARYGKTLALNPGTILGLKFQKGREECDPTFMIYETLSGEVTGYRVDRASERVIAME